MKSGWAHSTCLALPGLWHLDLISRTAYALLAADFRSESGECSAIASFTVESIVDEKPMTSHETCYQAVLARDPRFDGRFFVAVKTTGVYCRPICPARPKRENVEFFKTAQAAEKAGYRPCLRCRPEAAPGSPASKTKASSETAKPRCAAICHS